jgi:hypothetical protein
MLSIRLLSDVWETPVNVNDKKRMMNFMNVEITCNTGEIKMLFIGVMHDMSSITGLVYSDVIIATDIMSLTGHSKIFQVNYTPAT